VLAVFMLVHARTGPLESRDMQRSVSGTRRETCQRGAGAQPSLRLARELSSRSSVDS
jgi:hypothetical protein